MAKQTVATPEPPSSPSTGNPAEPTGVLARDCSNARYDDLYGPGPQRSYRAGFESFISWLDRL